MIVTSWATMLAAFRGTLVPGRVLLVAREEDLVGDEAVLAHERLSVWTPGSLISIVAFVLSLSRSATPTPRSGQSPRRADDATALPSSAMWHELSESVLP
jgi:hypothetical protein